MVPTEVSVVDLKSNFWDPDPTFQIISDPDGASEIIFRSDRILDPYLAEEESETSVILVASTSDISLPIFIIHI